MHLVVFLTVIIGEQTFLFRPVMILYYLFRLGHSHLLVFWLHWVRIKCLILEWGHWSICTKSCLWITLRNGWLTWCLRFIKLR